MKNTKLIYFLGITWGILFTLFGLVVYIFINAFMKNQIQEVRDVRGFKCLIMKSPRLGGASMGLWYMVGSRTDDNTQMHEMGHIIQNAMYGPFMIYIAIHSFIRAAFWKRTSKKFYSKNGYYPKYHSIWFEGQATTLGTIYTLNRKGY